MLTSRPNDVTIVHVGDSKKIEMMSTVSNTAEVGKFDSVSEAYSNARRGVPIETLVQVENLIGFNATKVLDLGCGTGISSGQISNHRRLIIGLDPSLSMIQQALSRKKNNVVFVFGDAESIPFEHNYFDAVTCFSSFHWFCTLEAEREIRRVLQPGSPLIIINKYEKGDLRAIVREILSKHLGKSLVSSKHGYKPAKFLQGHGWMNIVSSVSNYTEYYSYDDLYTYIKSFGSWGGLTETQKQSADPDIEELCRRLTSKGSYQIEVDVEVVSARNPQMN